MKNIKTLFLYLITTMLFVGCSDCDDCLDLQQKNILVLDNEGNNLLFGDNAIFNPATVTIRSGSEPPRELFIEEETQTLLFFLEEDQTTYNLQFDDNITTTLVFELGERKSERCCGNQIYSTATRLNGNSADNTDTITIVF